MWEIKREGKKMLMIAEIEKNKVTKIEVTDKVILGCISDNDLYSLEIYDYTSGNCEISVICSNEKNLGTINCYAGDFGVKFVQTENQFKTAKFKIWHDNCATVCRRYSIQEIGDDGVYCGNGYFSPYLERVLEWAEENYPNYRRVFEIIEVNDD